MLTSRLTKQIPNLSTMQRIVSIAFPNRPSWTPVVPEAPVIETEIDQWRNGTLATVLPLGPWIAQGPPDTLDALRSARNIYQRRKGVRRDSKVLGFGHP